MHPTVWGTIEHFKKEDSLAHAKWRVEMTNTEPVNHQEVVVTPPEAGSSRRKKQVAKITNLKILCSKYGEVTDKREYLNMISSLL